MRILLLLFFSALTFAQSKIEINGKTNVSKFTCSNQHPIIKSKQATVSKTGFPDLILMNVTDFRCNNHKMTKDFRKMMDYKNHPIVSIQNHHFKKTKNNTYEAISEVKINGIQKKYLIQLYRAENGWRLHKSIHLTDFELEPPSVLGGIIQVKDEVRINLFLQN